MGLTSLPLYILFLLMDVLWPGTLLPACGLVLDAAMYYIVYADKKIPGEHPGIKSVKPSQTEESSNLQTVPADGTGQITGVNTANAAAMLIDLLKNLGALDGKITAAATLNLDEECLRPKIFVCIIDRHFNLSSFHNTIITYVTRKSTKKSVVFVH